MNDAAQKKSAPVTAKKSFRDGHVALGIALKARDWDSDSIRINASTDLTVGQARALARTLVLFADEAEAKVKRKAAKEASRRKWREREIAAGRMVLMGGASR